MGGLPRTPVFDVHQLDTRGAVFRYVDPDDGRSVVGKFYGIKIPGDLADGDALRAQFMRREFDNLQHLRNLGFDRPPARVVRPLAADEAVNWVLIQEYAPGTDLHSMIDAVANGHDGQGLCCPLAAVATLFARLHVATHTGATISPATALTYLDKMIGQLAAMQLIDPERQDRFQHLRAVWAASGILGGAREVLIHGDATPPHFLFNARSDVTAIDLERLWPGDAAADLGCMAAELNYIFLHAGSLDGEANVRRFVSAYCAVSDDADKMLVKRIRFYQGCYQLRICRNGWLPFELKQKLIEDALARLSVGQSRGGSRA